MFHFKQAIVRRTAKTCINPEQAQMEMHKKCLDVLEIMSKTHATTHGIHCTKNTITSMTDFTKEDQVKWDAFWVCFEKFWCSDEKFITTWKTYDDEKNKCHDVHNHANNGLQR